MRMKLLIAIFVIAITLNLNALAFGSDNDSNSMEQSSDNANQNVLTVISSGSEIPSHTTSNIRANVPIPNQMSLEQPSYFGPFPPAWNDVKGSVLPFILFSVAEWTPEQAELLQHSKVASVFESFLRDKKNRVERIKVLNGFETLKDTSYTLAGYTITHGGTNETSMDCVMQAIKNCSEGGGNVLVLLKVSDSPVSWSATKGIGASSGASNLSGGTAGAGGFALGYASNKNKPQTETYCHAAILSVSPEVYGKLDRNGNIFAQHAPEVKRELTPGEEYIGSKRK